MVCYEGGTFLRVGPPFFLLYLPIKPQSLHELARFIPEKAISQLFLFL